MSYQQSIQSNNFNNTNKKLDHYQPQASNHMQVQSNTMLTSNLDLYIPRVAQGTTEEQIKAVFAHSRVGTVDYCDLSLTKDKDTKKPQHLSAFVKLISWSNLSGACEDFAKNGSIRLYLSRETSEFWMILPNKNPLPRSHVNTSQLAAATDKLFEQTEKITEKAEKFEDEMRAEMAEMRMFMKLQQQSIDVLKTEIATANVRILELTLENDAIKYQLKRSTKSIFGYDTIDAYEEAEEKKREETKLAEDKKLQDQFDAELDAILDMPLEKHVMTRSTTIDSPIKRTMLTEDTNDLLLEDALEELPLMPPKLERCSSMANWGAFSYACEFNNNMFISPKVETCEDECIFSSKPRQSPPIVTPIQVQSNSPIKMQTLAEIVSENPARAIASRDFCGNL